jgi:hypothetical protein
MGGRGEEVYINSVRFELTQITKSGDPVTGTTRVPYRCEDRPKVVGRLQKDQCLGRAHMIQKVPQPLMAFVEKAASHSIKQTGHHRRERETWKNNGLFIIDTDYLPVRRAGSRGR